MIDIHSHILPGLDDGAGDMNESIRMLRLARKQGITQVVATPHYSHSFQNTSPDQIRSLCREVQEAARRQLKAEIRVWPGQEIMYDGDVLDLLERGGILTIADSRYVLTEFLPSAPYSYIQGAVRELSLAGYKPILAHAERYLYLREKDRLDEISMCAPTSVCEIRNGWFQSYELTPEQFGYARCGKEELQGGLPEENAAITKAILNGNDKGAKRHAVCLNAGAALYIAGKSDTMEKGVRMAEELLDSGAAMRKLEEFIRESRAE